MILIINVINGERTRMRLLGHVFLGSTIIIASKERLLCNGYRYLVVVANTEFRSLAHLKLP